MTTRRRKVAQDELELVGTTEVKADPWAVDDFTVHVTSSGVEVEGLGPGDARVALELLQASRRVQYEAGGQYTARIFEIMGAADVELTPPAPVQQVRLLINKRSKLLATATYSISTLGEVLGTRSDAATRTWVSRKREKRQLFTVALEGRVLIPAFQLNEDASIRKDLVPVLQLLLDGGVNGWSLWTWLTEGTPLLSGAVPEKLAATEPDRALRAASRFVAGRASVA